MHEVCSPPQIRGIFTVDRANDAFGLQPGVTRIYY
jgi:hypothetical protein